MAPELRRTLSMYGLTMIAVGGVIGSGIFRTPGYVAMHVHVPQYVLLLWALGGLAALTGALTFAEMGSMFPRAGGLYVYLREAYGETAGFLYGWFLLFVSTSGTIAALSAVCSEHLLYLSGAGRDSAWETPLAIGIVVFLTVFNLFGVKMGEWLATVFTGAKLLGLALIIGAGWYYADPVAVAANTTGAYATTPPDDLWSGLALGFMGVMWSYGGWQHISFLAGETRNPQRNVPRAMILATLIVTGAYVLANLAYFRLLPAEQLAQSRTVAADALSRITPESGALMALLIALSTFGATSVYCMTAPRSYYAMAQDGIFIKKLAEIHPRWQTPVNAILLQNSWALVLLLFWGTFENLIEYVTFMDWLALMFTGAAIFVFRRRQPAAERVYRTTGYPFTPLVFIAICLWFVGFTLIQNPGKAGAGFLVGLVGWGVYRYFFKQRT